MSFLGIIGGVLFGIGIGFAFGIIFLSIKRYLEKRKLNKKLPEYQAMINKNKKEVKDVKYVREEKIREIEQRRKDGNLFKQSTATGMGISEERKPTLERRDPIIEGRREQSNNKNVTPRQRRDELSNVDDSPRNRFFLR